jgi:hypothetical protein
MQALGKMIGESKRQFTQTDTKLTGSLKGKK